MGRRKKGTERVPDKKSKHSRSVSGALTGLAPETKRGIAVVVLLVITCVSTLSLFHASGTLGEAWLRFLLMIFGVFAYLMPLFLALLILALVRHGQHNDEETGTSTRIYIGALVLILGIAGLIHLVSTGHEGSAFAVAGEGRGAGYLGGIIAAPVMSMFGFWAGSLILFAASVIGVLVMLDISLLHILKIKKEAPDPAAQKPQDVKINGLEDARFVQDKVPTQPTKPEEKNAPTPTPVIPKVVTKGTEPPVKLESIQIDERKDWKLPPFDLLDDTKSDVDSGNIEANMALIHKTLADFGIPVEMGEVNVGPTVTQYTLRPAQGIKLSAIAALQNDLALALAAQSLRMELPIPGKSLVGIEVPNKATRIVRLREVMQTNDFVNHKSRLAVALGRDVAGRPEVADLAKMPHLLIAGATGTGKSVALNSLFISLLYRNTPQDVKFIVVDPKRVEMTPYNGIPHLLTPVVMDHEKAVNALKWAVAEMDRRYKLLSEAHKRNIGEYNSSSSLQLPYIVILVDELADLMAVAQADVEAAIVRLSQMARAVGIHLVLATQYPTTEIITGLIKANITSRIAFAVASNINSRVILDTSGAEKLLGNGDALFVSSEFNKPRRVQGAYIGEKEVKKVVDFFKAQAGAVIYNEEILEKPKKPLGIPGFEEASDDDDELFEQAKQEVMQAGKASASFLQRRLKVGYARAARLLDILEERGIIGPGEGAKPREVYGVIPAEEKAEYGIDDEMGQ